MTKKAAELVMMRCEALQMNLSTGGCARLHAKAREEPPAAWDPKAACQFCPIGAANSGTVVAPMAEAVQSLERHCSRCQKPATRRIHNLFCVSCYNRDREVRVGRNRKGTAPRKLPSALHAATIVVFSSAGITITRMPRVAARTEALALLARGSTEPMSFGVPPLRLEHHL